MSVKLQKRISAISFWFENATAVFSLHYLPDRIIHIRHSAIGTYQDLSAPGSDNSHDQFKEIEHERGSFA